MTYDVLIVEDHAETRELLRLALEEEGWRIREAADGEECWELLHAAPERLIVLLDHVMPRLRGLDLLLRVAADPALAARHGFILLTASPDGQRINAETLFPEPMRVAVIIKPFSVETLVAGMQRLATALDAGASGG